MPAFVLRAAFAVITHMRILQWTGTTGLRYVLRANIQEFAIAEFQIAFAAPIFTGTANMCLNLRPRCFSNFHILLLQSVCFGQIFGSFLKRKWPDLLQLLCGNPDDSDIDDGFPADIRSFPPRVFSDFDVCADADPAPFGHGDVPSLFYTENLHSRQGTLLETAPSILLFDPTGYSPVYR